MNLWPAVRLRLMVIILSSSSKLPRWRSYSSTPPRAPEGPRGPPRQRPHGWAAEDPLSKPPLTGVMRRNPPCYSAARRRLAAVGVPCTRTKAADASARRQRAPGPDRSGQGFADGSLFFKAIGSRRTSWNTRDFEGLGFDSDATKVPGLGAGALCSDPRWPPWKRVRVGGHIRCRGRGGPTFFIVVVEFSFFGAFEGTFSLMWRPLCCFQFVFFPSPNRPECVKRVFGDGVHAVLLWWLLRRTMGSF